METLGAVLVGERFSLLRHPVLGVRIEPCAEDRPLVRQELASGEVVQQTDLAFCVGFDLERKKQVGGELSVLEEPAADQCRPHHGLGIGAPALGQLQVIVREACTQYGGHGVPRNVAGRDRLWHLATAQVVQKSIGCPFTECIAHDCRYPCHGPTVARYRSKAIREGVEGVSYSRLKVSLSVTPDGEIESTWQLGEQEPIEAQPSEPGSATTLLQSHRLKRVMHRELESEAAELGDARRAEIDHKIGAARNHLEDLGTALFEVMFEGSIRNQVVDRLERSLEDGGHARILISCDEQLEKVPWELVTTREGPLALREGVSIVRVGDTRHDDPLSPGVGPLRVLVVDAGCASRGFDELAPLALPNIGLMPSHAPVPISGAEVLWGDVSDVLDRRDGRYSAFHFTGHGIEGDAKSTPSLVFSAHGDPLGFGRIKCRDLAAALSGSGIRLAVLVACYAGTDDYWSGFGAALLEGGVPAVVSMQAPLLNSPGELFSRELYECLRRGDSIDVAVAAARRATAKADHLDWWVPVLHTRAPVPISFTPDAVPSEASPLEASESRTWTHGALPVLRDGALEPWYPPSSPPGVSSATSAVLSADGRSCAVWSADGTVVVGVLASAGGSVRWWAPLTQDPGTSVVAVHAHPFSAELLVTAERGTRVLALDGAGRSVTRGPMHTDRATAGTWTGFGFSWISTEGEVLSDEVVREPADRLLAPKGNCRGLDAALEAGEPPLVGAQVAESSPEGRSPAIARIRLACWLVADDRSNSDPVLVVQRSLLGVRQASEERRISLSAVPDEVLVARPAVGEAPDLVLARTDDRIIGWNWSALHSQP